MDLIKANLITCPVTTGVMYFEVSYDGLSVDLIMLNIIYLSRDNRGNVLKRDARDCAWISSR